jgi:type IV secretion system protein VirD4
MPRRRISPLFAVFVAFVVLMASNAWLKSIFGYGEIATNIPFLLAGAVLFLAWQLNRRAANQRSDLLGSARFGDRADVRKLEANGDLLIGRSAKSRKLLHYDGAAHLLTMAPTRSGKGVGTIIPNLLLDRSAICIDPKGENVRVTARVRAAKGKVWCLDPFGVSGQPPPATIRSTGSIPPASILRKMPIPFARRAGA